MSSVAQVFIAQCMQPRTKLDIDECAKDNGGCHAKRECDNTNGGMKCGDCAAGWDNDGEKGCKGLFLLPVD